MTAGLDFALFGAAPRFSELLPAGQLYYPEWKSYQKELTGIFERKYYTNQGPLVQLLEQKLQDYLGSRNVICVTNMAVGLLVSAQALTLKGKILVPYVPSALPLAWMGLDLVFCDLDLETLQMSLSDAEEKLQKDTITAVMGAHLWGGSCLPERFSEAAKAQSAAIFYDASHAFGCEIQKKTIGSGERIEIFSLHETEILSGGEGGFITTNDDDLAEMLRNIRPSYLAPVRKIFEGTRTANARMSEAQAAITLLNLENIQKYRKTNELLFQSYQRLLRTISGVQIVEPAGITLSNYSRLICLIDEKQFGVNRDMLLQILRAENVEVLVPVYYPLPVNSKTMLPNTQRIAMNAVQLPLGSKVTPDHIESICEIIERIHENSIAICSKLEAS